MAAGVVVAGGSAAASRPARSVNMTAADNKAGAVISRGADETGGLCSGRGTRIVAPFNLNPARSASKARGIAEIASRHSSAWVCLLASGLKANTKHDAYAVWLYNAPTDAHLLGFVSPAVGHKGRLRAEGILPRHWRHFRQLIISLETSARPRRPHHIVLMGNLPKHRGVSG
jgi:hypothetical protein